MPAKRSQLYIAIVCLILGILFAVQFKATSFYKASLVPSNIEDLNQQLTKLSYERDAVKKKVSILNEKLESKRNSNQIMSDIQKELQLIKMSGGLYPCKGPGISIRLNSFQSNDSSYGSIADADCLLTLINDLKASGAEAIAVNDQRITAMSEVCWTGTIIMVNGNQISPPYQIMAIGHPNNLERGMMIKRGYLDNLQLQIPVSLKKLDQIIIPAFNGPTKMSFAKPAQ